jgi:beta-N-acetylhexosaminidase
MYGGVAGHAGLFGKANDLAVMMQMMLNGGKYGDVEFFDEKTVQRFTKGNPFKADVDGDGINPNLQSDEVEVQETLLLKASFGHTGFTGTCVWADPENNFIYVFLSNRVHPYAENNLLLKDGVRQEIHDIIYKAMEDPVRKDILFTVNGNK